MLAVAQMSNASGRSMVREPVDGNLLHRKNEADRFVTSVARESQSRWSCGVEVSRDHPRMSRFPGALPEVVVLEIFRQGAFLNLHDHLNLPVRWFFPIQKLGMTESVPLTFSGDRLHADLTIDLVGCRTKRGVPRYIEYEFHLKSYEGGSIRGNISTYCVSQEEYEPLRLAYESPAALTPSSEDLLGAGSAALAWRDDDPFLLANRPSDHILAMQLADGLLTEAKFRNPLSSRVKSIQIAFRHFAKRDELVLVEASPHVQGTFSGRCVQGDAVVVEFETIMTR